MPSDIKITVTGGAVSIGALSQGNANSVAGQARTVQPALDLAALAEELVRLQRAMAPAAASAGQRQALEAVANAAGAAGRGDEASTWAGLKAAGRWALEVATTIGTDLAAKALQVALQLP